MMRAVREARAALNRGRNKPRELCVNYDFIDIEPETIDYLNYWLNGRADDKAIDMEDKQRTSVRCADFLAELPRIRNEIKQRRFGERAIFILDQYNYNDLPMAEMAGLMRDLKGSEIILTFNVGSLLTYISDHAANRKPMARIGLEKYIPGNRSKHSKQPTRSAGAKFCSAMWRTGSRLKPERNSPRFSLYAH